MRSVNSLTTLNSMLQKLFHPQLVWDAFEKAEYRKHFQTTTMPSEFTWHFPSLTRKERDRLLCWPFSVLKRVMNQRRSTIGQDKMCDLSLFKADLTNNMDFECIVSEFAQLKSRKKTTYNHVICYDWCTICRLWFSKKFSMMVAWWMVYCIVYAPTA